jgi:hypothetical protein
MNNSSLVAFEINKSPSEIAKNIDFSHYKVFVGDGDQGLKNFYNGKIDFHLCHRHAINDVSYYLWRNGMKKRDKEELMNKFKSILYTLQNSVKKYWNDRDNFRLVNRIVKTLILFLPLNTKEIVSLFVMSYQMRNQTNKQVLPRELLKIYIYHILNLR